MTKDIMDVKEVADYLGFSPTKIYRMLTAGDIPNVKVGGQYRFPRNVIDDWLAGKLAVPGSKKSTGNIGKKGNRGRREETRTEDAIVGLLTEYLKTGMASKRADAKKTMLKDVEDMDWRYLAAIAEKAGVLTEAIAVEKEINRGR